MAFLVAHASSINIFVYNHIPRRRHYLYLSLHDFSEAIRRSCLPRGSLASALKPREFPVQSRAAADDGVPAEDIEVSISNANSGEGYIGLFVQMLGLDNNPVDREHAVMTLWKYSDGGKNFIDVIMKFPGCVKLVLSLLKSGNFSTCEAAAGLLRNISSVNLYRDIIAESGVIEEIVWLLHQPCLTIGVKEQSLCTLWNLSIDEKTRIKIAHGDFLPLLVKFLDDEEIKVKEAAGGVLANLSLSPCNHNNMVEAGVIPKLANLFKSDAEGLKVIRKSAKTALLELSKDDYYRVLIIEEGLIQVPLIGAAAYKSLRSQSHSWPSLPDGTDFERTSCSSRYGATELLLGLSVREKNINLEEAKINAMVGRSQQQFLARIGAIESDERRSESNSSFNQRHTLLPCIDGVARLVLFLGLEDVSAITRAALSIADGAISEHLRILFKEAGAIQRLVTLLSHDDKLVQEAVVYALDRLLLSYEVLQTIEAESIMRPLVGIIRLANASESTLEKIVNILHRVINLGECMEGKIHEEEFFSGSNKRVNSSYSSINKDVITRASKTSSVFELISRERVIDSDVVKYLIRMLKTSSPTLQTKIASIFEYLTSFKPYVMMLTISDIESGLHAVFQNLLSNCEKGLHGFSDYNVRAQKNLFPCGRKREATGVGRKQRWC
ncbi:uncharacterized protein LOC110018317 [Phalaenopsis equestris]|uniref:uncharacterized protein LOC110018317 n=1 Tax=Phalaenopsis equestris TaxID=78828 RepID=UPI0009E2B740|nr:uncharacterized protein LOC110018317 [Phalaenopsis equestris]